jgi:hypothetical protein
MKRPFLTLWLLAGLVPALGLVLCRGLPLSAAEVAPAPEPGTLVMVAGTGQPGFSGDEGPAVAAKLRVPLGLAVDALGDLLIADWGDDRVRKVDTQGIVTTFAGTGKNGSSGDNGPAREARLNSPDFITCDGEGSVLIAEDLGYRVRKVSADGLITTFAGTGRTGSSGEGGLATRATFNLVDGLAVDRNGNVYIAASASYRVWKVNREGIITTYAGTGVRGSSGDGGPATQARLNAPVGLALDREGNLYISEFGDFPYFGGNIGSRVRKVSPDGIITTVAGIGPKGFSGDGGPATAAQLKYPFGLAVDSAGNLFIADLGNYRVRKVDPQGIISTVAGTGPANSFPASGPATATPLRAPSGLAIDAAGNLYISSAIFIPFDQLRQPDARIVKVYRVAAPGLIAGLPFPQPLP